MPTIRAPRRKCQPRPQDKPPSYVMVETAPPVPVIPDPATLPKDLLYQRERAYAICMSFKFEEWLVLLAARDRVPLDDCLGTIGILTVFVEVFLVAAATWPRLFSEQVAEEEDEPAVWSPRTVAEANAEGLAVVRKGKPRRSVPTLPGCHGHDDKGAPCQQLRFYGQKFCPACERGERQRLRAM